MAQVKQQDEIKPSGQEEIKPLSTTNSVEGGVLVRPKEDTVIIGAKDSILGEGVKHTVHRILAEKLIKKGQAKKAD